MQGKSLWFGNWDGVDRSVGMGSRDKAVRTGRSCFGGRPPLIRLVTGDFLSPAASPLARHHEQPMERQQRGAVGRRG